ncbi:MAG TPA: pentapeptide repeat-containing protein [Chloroflexota bacterium]|nr:pentapeptide repeat-containing protein [Chloroflexota bacterium]
MAGTHNDKPRKGWFVRGAPREEAGEVRHKPGRLVAFFLLLAIVAGLALWLVPHWQVAPARERLQAEESLSVAEQLALENNIFQAENGARMTLAVILAASGLLLGLGIAWRRYELSRELKAHERFAPAVEQLGSERGDGSVRTEARLGGIYALERLLQESEREYWPIVEVLTAYVRENAAWRPDDRSGTPGIKVGPLIPHADIQAILAVLGRRHKEPNGERRLLDLRETDLRGANLSGCRFDGVTLAGAHLEKIDGSRAVLSRSNLREVDLSGASLTEADLSGASLARANLEGARLNGANLSGADLSGANLRGADLWESNLKGCNLKDTDLRGADLSQADLTGAIMWRADLQDAVLTAAHLTETHLERANLAGAVGLTWEQGEDAYTDENTILPDYLVPEQVRGQLTSAVIDAPTPPPPTPAARRSPTTRAKPFKAALPSPAPPAPEPAKDNVVHLKSASARSRKAKAAQAKAAAAQEPVPPKKAAVPKHRKQGLVKPA